MRTVLAAALVGLALACAGCAEEPDVMAAREGLLELPRGSWERVPAGCELQLATPRLRLFAIDGEPALGALVGPRGPVCVDALFLLVEPRRDPTPTPMLPR